jgi:transcriptional regulator with XRE-family HTH domain
MEPNGPAFRTVRVSQHLGLRQLARRVGKSHQFLGRLEAGSATASEETMRRIAHELGVPVEAITHPKSVSSR